MLDLQHLLASPLHLLVITNACKAKKGWPSALFKPTKERKLFSADTSLVLKADCEKWTQLSDSPHFF